MKPQWLKSATDPKLPEKIAGGKYVPVTPLEITPVRGDEIKPVFVPRVK